MCNLCLATLNNQSLIVLMTQWSRNLGNEVGMVFVPHMQDLSLLGQLELFNFDKLDSGQTQVTDSLNEWMNWLTEYI